MYNTKFYRIYWGIISRCYNPIVNNYSNYGGRGVSCSWKTFEEFKKDMHKSYLNAIRKFGFNYKQICIDRINNNGNYSKENCRWTNQKKQQRNRRNNHLVIYKGEKLCIAECCEKYGVNPLLIYNRIYSGWPIEKAIETKIRGVK